MVKWLNSTTLPQILFFILRYLLIPLKSLTSILKAAKISGHLLLRESKDPLVSDVLPKLKVGKWDIRKVVSTAEVRNKFQEDSRCGPKEPSWSQYH